MPNEPESFQIRGTRYRVVKQLSMQSRGRFLVEELQPHNHKVLRLAIVLDDDVDTKQFERSLRRLPTDANTIPRLMTPGYWDGRKVWILSWQQGHTLAERLRLTKLGEDTRPSVWVTVQRMRSLAHTLRLLNRYCHIAHGDIRPANLIVPSQPGSISLIDYGSSWQLEKGNERTLGDGYDPLYAAPEMQNGDGPLDYRVDQFSASVVCYEMLTLELPFGGYGGKAGWTEFRAELEHEYTNVSQRLERPESIPRHILMTLDQVVARGLSLDVDNRYATPSEFCQAWDSLWAELQVSHSKSLRAEDKMPTSAIWLTLMRWLDAFWPKSRRPS